MKADTTGQPGRWGWNSLRLRFLLAIALWVALGIGGLWYAATKLFAKHVEQQHHAELDVHIRELKSLVKVAPDGTGKLVRPLSDPRYLVPFSGFYWQVTIDGGSELRSASMVRGRLDENIAHSPSVLHQIETGPTGPAITYGVLGHGPRNQEIHFVVATDQRLLDDAVAAFMSELTLWLAVLAITLAMTGLSIIAFGLRPLDRLGRAIARLRRGESAKLEGAYPSEIAPLVENLNAFIDQNAKIIEQARVQAGNLAHGLRTPLAIVVDEAERLAQREGQGDSAVLLLDQARVMVQQIDYQLARSRSAAGIRPPGAITRLPDAILPVLSAMRRLHPDIDFALDDDGQGTAATLPVDPIDFRELVSNLLDNAGKWARAHVRITVTATDGSHRIEIVDDGPGLNADQIEKAFGIGIRLDPDKPGSGLGLTIARDIADAYGLTLTLAPASGGAPGLQALLIIPASAAR